MLGLEGRAWLARAEAEWRRANGDCTPEAWEAVLAAFDHGFVYEAARARWRLAEALAETGAGKRQRAVAGGGAAGGRAARQPLRRALDDLARRARIGTARPPVTAGLAALTSRERDVLRLIAAGRSNREIASALFIAPKPPAFTCRTSWPSSAPPAVPRPPPSRTARAWSASRQAADRRQARPGG